MKVLDLILGLSELSDCHSDSDSDEDDYVSDLGAKKSSKAASIFLGQSRYKGKHVRYLPHI